MQTRSQVYISAELERTPLLCEATAEMFEPGTVIKSDRRDLRAALVHSEHSHEI